METLLAAVAVQFSSATETIVIIDCAHTLKQGNRLKEGLNTLDRTICQINRSLSCTGNKRGIGAFTYQVIDEFIVTARGSKM